MKKILTLSALGCLATVGAVFAAFTLDPSTETDPISVTHVDVDLSAQVFSKFDPVTSFTYVNESTGENPFPYDGTVPVADPQGTSEDDTEFRFGLKAAEGGGQTLDLKCVNSFNYEKWLQYVTWRNANEEPDPTDPEKAAQHAAWVIENEKMAPRGYAFKYEYDESFLAKIKVDDTIPEMMKKAGNEWMYPIYKTNFSAGLTMSKFTADGLLTHGGIIYTQPVESNPDYKLFDWDKSDIQNPTAEWIHGNDSFYILPDIVKDEGGHILVSEKSGTMIFNGKEMTKDLFSGTFADADAIKDCADYLEDAEDHKSFNVKLKATEYFRTNSFELKVDPDTSEALYLYNPGDSEVLETNTRHSFSFTVTDTTAQLITLAGYQLNGFCILDTTGIMPLTNSATTALEDLSLKVTKTSANGNGIVEDITDMFTYENDTSSADYGSIKYTGTGLSLNAGDVVAINFLFRKDNTGKIKEIPFKKAAIKLNKPNLYKDDQIDQYVEGDKKWAKDYTDATLEAGAEVRFRFPIDSEKVYPDTFKIIDGDGDDIELKTGDVQIELYFEGPTGTPESLQYDIPLDVNYFTINDDGTVTINDLDEIIEKYCFTDLSVFKLGVVVKNNTHEGMTFSRVEMAAEDILTPEVLQFDTVWAAEGDGGYFTFKNQDKKKLMTGQPYEALISLGTPSDPFSNYLKSILVPGLQSGKWDIAQFGLQILNDSSKPLSFGDAGSKFKIKVTRFKSTDISDELTDTEYYSYDSTVDDWGIKTAKDKEEDYEYVSQIATDIGNGYDKLKIRFVYNGADEQEFGEMRLNLKVEKL